VTARKRRKRALLAVGAGAVAVVTSIASGGAPDRGVAAQSAPQRRLRTELPSGMLLLVEENHDLPLVEVQITLRTGSAHDPEDMVGLARTTARMVRMGTRRMRAPEVEEAIDALGGSLGIETAPSYTRFSGSVIKRNVGPFLALVGQLLAQPAMRAADLEQVRREALADLVELRDNDRALGARELRRALFGDHPYGRPVLGTQRSLQALDRAAVVAHWQRHYVASNVVLGVAGDVTPDEARALVERHFAGLPTGERPRDEVPAPRIPRGRRVVIVDKPARTQTQIYIGTLGTLARDPDHVPLVVANTVFGGTFTARLMREIRTVRGWSYGASSRLGLDRRRELWMMHTFPAAADTVACVALQLEMLEALVARGITREELAFAQDYLAKSYAFEIDTASKRLDQRIDVEVFGLPRDYYARHVERVRAVRREEANAALRARLSTDDLAIVVVATASEVRDGLAALPGVASVEVVPYDRD
jgi:zinc protease